MLPERIGRYRIDTVLGAGGMGEVYKGWDEELQRPVAIKGALRDTPTPEQRERLRREARSVAALAHPNVAHIYEIVHEAGREWIVMEFVPGRSLASILRDGPLPASEIARIGAEVADALAFAHQHGIVHRDIKVENVMVTPEGHVKVLDFGLAKWTDTRGQPAHLTADGLVVGTTKAMSPEQALGREVDERSDIFSLGSLLYELACGKPAFAGGTAAEVMHRVAGCDFEPLAEANPRLPTPLRRIIERCMAKSPADRFPSATELARALRTADLGGGTAMATRVLAATTLASRVRQHWRLATVATTVLALLVGAAVRLGWLSSTPPRVVAVLPATASDAGEPASLATAAVSDAVVAHLARLAGIVTVSGREVRAVAREGKRSTELARELGAHEVVEASLTRGGEGQSWRVALARVDGASGRVLWSSTVEVAGEDLFLLQDRVTTLLEDGYRGFSVASSGAPREATPASLRAYLTVEARLERGQTSQNFGEEIELLRSAVAASPRYLPPLLDLAAIHRYLFATTHDPLHRQAMDDAVARAVALAPADPSVRLVQVAASAAKGDTAAALEQAEALTRARPGDPHAWAELGRTLNALGRPDEAERALRRAYALRPAWQTLYFLADVRRARGDYAGAREALAPILASAPANVAALAKLAEVEMYAGEFERSETLYRKVVDQRGNKSDLTNLGNAVFFQGRWAEAIDLYRRASALAPNDPLPIANLADALWAAGDRAAAAQEYQRGLALCERQLASGRRTRTLLDLRARCLAHLGRGEEAVLAAQDAIREFPDNPETTFVAALVAAINGDETTCLAWTRRAIELGAPRAWFAGPEFERLAGKASFRALLAQAR